MHTNLHNKFTLKQEQRGGENVQPERGKHSTIEVFSSFFVSQVLRSISFLREVIPNFMAQMLSHFKLRPHPHRTRDAMRNTTCAKRNLLLCMRVHTLHASKVWIGPDL